MITEWTTSCSPLDSVLSLHLDIPSLVLVHPVLSTLHSSWCSSRERQAYELSKEGFAVGRQAQQSTAQSTLKSTLCLHTIRIRDVIEKAVGFKPFRIAKEGAFKVLSVFVIALRPVLRAQALSSVDTAVSTALLQSRQFMKEPTWRLRMTADASSNVMITGYGLIAKRRA